MKLLEPVIALGMWALLGIAADSTGYTEVLQETEQMWEKEETDKQGWMTEEFTEETDTGAEWESESETEDLCIRVDHVRLKEEEKYYDGTSEVEVEAEVTGLPENMNLRLSGSAESSDAGTWKVNIEAALEGEDSENYRIETEESQLWVTIKPKPLRIRISNARKCYHSDNEVSNLIFEEDQPMEISGFLEQDQKANGLPEGFEWPELTIDENILQKDSPMYERGKEIRYVNAVTLKRDGAGKITGNPTENYTFNIEETEFFDGGDVVLSATPISGTLDYTVKCSDPEAFRMDENGNFWIRNGESLVISPTENCGFTEGKMISGIYGDGTEEFCLIRRNQAGEIIAESQTRSISWQADGEAPKGVWILDGKQMKAGSACYVNCDTQIAYSYVQDGGSGIRSIELYAAYDEEKTVSGEDLYREKRKAWSQEGRLLLDRQGVCKVWVRTEDQVGNVQYSSSEDVITDRTAPEIWFENILAGSANKKEVEPICKVKDEYLQSDSLKVTLTGYQNGTCQVIWKETEAQDQKEIQMKMENLPFNREWDDVYTLRAEVKDLAGNCSSREIVFSVNRFGSVYYLGEETKQLTDRFYVSSPEDVKIYEVNVDYLTESGILLGHEGETRQLEKDRDYTVKKTGDDKSWKEYCYTISSGCFEEEGLYYLICASEDRALNVSDNRMRKQRLEFAVDKSEPDILLTGIEENGVYKEKEKIVSLECRDNLALKEVTVYVNGKKIRRNDREEQNVELQERDEWQKIRITAEDKAGNRKDTGEMYFWLGRKEPDFLQKNVHVQEKKNDIVADKKEDTKVKQMEKESETASQGKEKRAEKSRKILAVIAVTAVIWAIFLKAKKEK